MTARMLPGETSLGTLLSVALVVGVALAGPIGFATIAASPAGASHATVGAQAYSAQNDTTRGGSSTVAGVEAGSVDDGRIVVEHPPTCLYPPCPWDPDDPYPLPMLREPVGSDGDGRTSVSHHNMWETNQHMEYNSTQAVDPNSGDDAVQRAKNVWQHVPGDSRIHHIDSSEYYEDLYGTVGSGDSPDRDLRHIEGYSVIHNDETSRRHHDLRTSETFPETPELVENEGATGGGDGPRETVTLDRIEELTGLRSPMRVEG